MIIQLQVDIKQTAGSPAKFLSKLKGIKGASTKRFGNDGAMYLIQDSVLQV